MFWIVLVVAILCIISVCIWIDAKTKDIPTPKIPPQRVIIPADVDKYKSEKVVEHVEQNVAPIAPPKTTIVWSAELRGIRTLMFLAPPKGRFPSIGGVSGGDNTRNVLETMSEEEKYNLALLFAERIAKADSLRAEELLSEERAFCYDSIKWCAHNGLSVIYWQNRINEINELEGKPKIKTESVTIKKGVGQKAPQKQPAKQSSVKASSMVGCSMWEFDNKITEYLHRKEYKKATELAQKAIAYAQATNHKYYEEKATKMLKIISETKAKLSNNPIPIPSTKKSSKPSHNRAEKNNPKDNYPVLSSSGRVLRPRRKKHISNEDE